MKNVKTTWAIKKPKTEDVTEVYERKWYKTHSHEKSIRMRYNKYSNHTNRKWKRGKKKQDWEEQDGEEG